MYQRTKKPYQLNELVKSFELQQVTGSFQFWEYDDMKSLIHHYEDSLNYQQALKVVDLALQRYPYQCDIYLQKSRLLAVLSQIDQSLEVLDEALTVAPGEPEIRLLRSEVLYSVGRYHEALPPLKEIEDRVTGEELCFLFIRQSKIYEAMKDFDLMFDTLKLVLEIDPDNNQALEDIWMSVEHSKRYEDSIVLHTHILDKNPYSHLAWFNLGHAFSCIGDYKKAIEALEYAFIIYPEFEAAYMDCAELCFQERMFGKAYEVYEEVNERFGPDAEVLVFMVECLLPLKEYKKAQKLLLLALTLDPYNDEVHFYLGECHAANENWKEAVKAYNKAIKIDERREEYLMSIAKVYGLIGKKDLAIHYYKKATSAAPEQNSYWVEYAQYVKENIGLEAALDILNHADDFAVGSDLSLQKACCMFELGLEDQALEILEEVLMDDPMGVEQRMPSAPLLNNNPKVQAMIKYYRIEEL